jgi:hypothetical protein
MTRALAWISSCVLVSCSALSSPACAQYTPERESSFWLRAMLDLRLVGGGPAPSWTDGGPGKMRYGGSFTDSGFQRATRIVMSQAALQVGAFLPWGLRAQAQVNIEPDIADNYKPWLIEAILRKEWGDERLGWGMQGGVMHVPFSLENTGPAWSPEFTLSASALDNWLWEDISLAGAEAEGWYVSGSGVRVGALLGAGYGGDQIGRLLALRGWVVGDTLGGINGDLALPVRGQRTNIFSERDQQPALYTWLSLGDEEKIASVNFGFMDNRGDESKPAVWHAHFTTVGLTLNPFRHFDVLVQYLSGTARVQGPPNDSGLSAFYALLSYRYLRQRVSLRYDAFRIHDLDGGPSTGERGHAETAAYLIDIGLRQRIALEYVWMHSQRDATGSLNPTPGGWQLSYRIRY